MRRLVSRFCDLYLGHYRISAAIALILFAVSLYGAIRVFNHIDSNQLNLLPQDLPQVGEARKIIDMVGGTGYLIITLKMDETDEGDRFFEQARVLKHQSRDKEAQAALDRANAFYEKNRPRNQQNAEMLMKVSDELYDDLIKLKEVKFIRHKFSVQFIKDRMLYFMQPDDLSEAIRRISIKRDELIEKANPFYIELEDKNYRLDLSDIIRKYRKIGKKEVVDYYVSPDRKMMILTVKPTFSMNEIDQSRELIEKIKQTVEKHELKKRGIAVGLTGSYVSYVDNYDSISNSLGPTLWVSLSGISLILILFIKRKRPIGPALAVNLVPLLLSCVYAVVLTFGLTYLVIGKLNIITAIFGGILAGFGIDFGIQFIYRFREEFWHRQDLMTAIKEAIIHTGSAAFSSTLTIAAAFAVMIISRFKGFSEFGLISAYGTVIIALVMFFITPLQIVILARIWPAVLDYLQETPEEKREEEAGLSRFNIPRLSRIILMTVPVGFALALVLARNVEFDNDSRNMLAADLASETLREEMDLRYDIAGDPLAIATGSIEEAQSLFEYLEPLSGKMGEYVGQVVSVFSFVPPPEQQQKNYQLMQQFHASNSSIKPALLPPEQRAYYPIYERMITQPPFDFQDMPDYITHEFHSVPQSKVQGWLTFIYPQVDKLFLAQDIEILDALVGELEFPAVGRRTIQKLAIHTPAWEARSGRRFSGSTDRKEFDHYLISEREKNAVVDMANRMSESELSSLKIMPLVARTIIKNRPYASLEDLQKEKWHARTTGSTILIAKFTRIVKDEARTLVIGTSLLVVVILFLGFRSLLASVVALIPLILGMVTMVGVMTVLGVRFNYFNIAIVPIIIGYGMNGGIFVMFRFFEDRSVSTVLFRTAAAILASNLTALAGWGSLAIAVHPGIRSMGYAACIGIATVLVSSVVVLPAIIQIIEERYPGKLRMGKPWFFRREDQV